ncbi:LysR family transcriptional regulator [Pseudoalteromonas sp. A25]|uniref:LysR family transcriptional regulator n=1 Tax=Pseudoalteromonas sp. A25 TaxID=116092 RepID=UPI001260F7B0|nr:LysR family transcriptional regulator [Pseudoalteromonas sp. A25]BBN82195.1 LysR family transcriptional regulator [Pseudoalteromonas sp. A25]
MDWRSVNFDWNHARSFLVTAREGSLSAGARALGLTQPTLGRQVASLEAELGVALFERVGRGLSLTPTGLKLVEHVEAMSEAANLFSLAASGQSDSIEGNVVISASEATSAFILPQILLPFRALHPGISLQLLASNAASDLTRREADIAIRGFRPHQPDLIARRIKDMEFGFYASPSYLAGVDCSVNATDFNSLSFLGFDHTDMMINELNKREIPATDKNFSIVCENHLVQWEMVKMGFGIGIMATSVGDNEPCVTRVFKDIAPFVGEQWLVAHRELRSNRRIRAVYDFLAHKLAR